MAFDGNGTYTPKSPEYPATAGTVIKAADWNAVISDIASALSLVLVRDGQSAMVNHLNMGAKKVQNLADGTVSTDAVTFGQIMTAAIVALKALTPAADAFPFFDSTSTASLLTIVSAIRTVLASADVATMRTNMGLGDSATKNTGTTAGTVSAGDHNHSALYQPLDADLTALAGLTSAADKVPYFTGSGTADLMTVTAAARTLLDDIDAATMRTTLGLTIGTNVQAYDATLAALASLTVAADKLVYATGADAFSTCDLTTFARTLLAASSAVAARTVLGVQASIGDALSVMYALLYCRSQSRASGPVPSGYIFALLTDELTTKTNAAFDSSGKYYHNAGSASYTQAQTLNDSAAPAGAAVLAQSFQVSTTDPITKFKWRNYTATGTAIDWTIETDSSGAPSGTKVASTAQALNVAGPGTSTTDQEVTLDAQFTPSTGVTYWLVARLHGGGSLPSNLWAYKGGNPYASGNAYNGSAQTYDFTFGIYQVSPATNMTLIPAAVTTASHPSSVTVRFPHKSVDSVTYGTDLKLRVSTDNGSNWSSYGTITKLCTYDANYDLLEATIDTSALTGTSLKPEISTANAKSQQVAGIALSYT